MKLSLALILVMSGCAAPKKRLVIPPGCIKRIEPIKACEPEKDGTCSLQYHIRLCCIGN
jgi:hypothetical protein